MRSSLLTSLLLSFSLVSLQADDNSDPEKKSTLPAMKVLPVGSSLHAIRAPRFDENYKKISLLTAARMDILSKHKLKGTDVDLTLYREDGIQAATHLNSVFYFESTGVIHSDENITISGESFDIASQGLTLDWEKHAGFLLGKTQTMLYSDKDQKMHPSIFNTPDKPAPIKRASKATAQAAAVLATIPALLTADELQQISQFAEPSTAIIQSVDQQTQREIKHVELTADTIGHSKDTLRGKLDQEVGNTTTLITAEPLAAKNGQVPITITSDNGMYFDATKGVIVYSKDVSVVHPQYQLSCTDELKIQLSEEPSTHAAQTSVDSEATSPNQPNTDQIARFNGLNMAIATGNVVIRAKDNKGQLIVAKAEIVSYNGKTGITILKGGQPTITQGDTIARVLSNTGYIKILPNMSTRIEGKHEIKTNLKQLQNSQQ